MATKSPLQQNESQQVKIQFDDPSITNGRTNGKLTRGDKIIYDGGWLFENGDAYKDGEGIERYPDGSRYVGNFSKSKKNGFGTLYREKFGTYRGNWENDVPNGEGEIEYYNGDKYIGIFVDGKKQGKGKYIIKETGVYIGDFLNNSLNGEGKLFYNDDSSYIGEFKNNKRHGLGKLYDASNNLVENGMWENDKLIEHHYHHSPLSRSPALNLKIPTQPIKK